MRMYFPDVNAQLILVIQWSVNLLYNFEYVQAILFKQILVGAVMGSKSFKVSWEIDATVDPKNHSGKFQ